MLAQEVCAALQLRAVDVGHELQVHPGLSPALGHGGGIHAGMVHVHGQPAPVRARRAAHHHIRP
eukprot:13958049-Alexandrium_andersonii.AAC.1